MWAALTDPTLLAQWWVPGDIEPIVGNHFVLEMPGWGDVPCEVLDVVVHERLAYTFADWTLTWRLAVGESGTRLLLDQSGFNLDNPQHRFAFENMGPGWRDEILPRRAVLVESAD